MSLFVVISEYFWSILVIFSLKILFTILSTPKLKKSILDKVQKVIRKIDSAAKKFKARKNILILRILAKNVSNYFQITQIKLLNYIIN